MSTKWTHEALKLEALKYKTRNEFNKGSPSAYQSAHSKDLLDKVCCHMPVRVSMKGSNNPNYKWTDEDLAKEALKYNTRSEFYINKSGAYQMANDRNILDIICSHMKNPLLGENNPNYKWTDGFIKEKALEFSNSAAFKKHFPLLYAAARHRGILESVCKHMKRIHRMTYTESELHSIAAQHERRHGFRKNHDGAYQAATKLGILDKICQHMSKSRSVSFAELQLFNEIKNIHPNARKFRDYHVAVEGKPYIKRFEIDIFIPTLNKGIEFDGKYWHTFEVMRIQEHKKNWSDEDIRNYSNIKDNYFKSKGIIILHITEKEWKEDKEQSLTKVLKFLGE